MKNRMINTYECVYYTLEDVMEAVEEFKMQVNKLAEMTNMNDIGDVYGEYEVVSERGNDDILLITKIIVNA
jgi:hypothetical protein